MKEIVDLRLALNALPVITSLMEPCGKEALFGELYEAKYSIYHAFFHEAQCYYYSCQIVGDAESCELVVKEISKILGEPEIKQRNFATTDVLWPSEFRGNPHSYLERFNREEFEMICQALGLDLIEQIYLCYFLSQAEMEFGTWRILPFSRFIPVTLSEKTRKKIKEASKQLLVCASFSKNYSSC